MAAENVNNNSNGGENAVAENDKVSVGTFSFSVTPAAITRITDQIGKILEAQVILRGETSLGYGTVTFNVEGEPVEGSAEFTGPAKLGPDARSAKPKKSSRGKGRKEGGRARRSADDIDPNSEEAAANGATSVKAVTDSLGGARIDNEDSAAGSAVERAAAQAVNAANGGRGGRAKRGARGTAATRAPRPKRERGEPSKTLVFIRNIPYTFTEEKLASVLSSSNLVYKSVSVPVHKFGKNRGQGRGFGFANVETEEEQSKIIETLDGKEVNASGLVDPSESAPAQPAATEEKPAGSTTEGEEGATKQPRGERKLILHVRKGYDSDVDNAEGGDNSQATAGHEDSGTAETEETAAPANVTAV